MDPLFSCICQDKGKAPCCLQKRAHRERTIAVLRAGILQLPSQGAHPATGTLQSAFTASETSSCFSGAWGCMWRLAGVFTSMLPNKAARALSSTVVHSHDAWSFQKLTAGCHSFRAHPGHLSVPPAQPCKSFKVGTRVRTWSQGGSCRRYKLNTSPGLSGKLLGNWGDTSL